MNVHIYPLNDLEPHTLSSGCACGPQRNRDGYYIHLSYDGRESDPNNGIEPLSWTFDIAVENE